MQVGTAPISWGVSEMPDWGQVLPFAQVLDEMAETDYMGTELGPWGYLPDNVVELRAGLSRRGLALIGGFCPLTLHLADKVAEQRRFAADVAKRLRDLGAEVMVLAEAGDAVRLAQAGHVVPGQTPQFTAEDWQRFSQEVDAVAAMARQLGLTTGFHPHVGSYVETEEEAEQLLALTDQDLVGLCIDTGHLTYAGTDAVTFTERHRQRVRHVHLKDVSATVLQQARVEGWSFATAVGKDIFVPLGAGAVNLPAMLSSLAKADYAGWLVVEQDRRLLGTGQASLSRQQAQESRTYLRALGC